MRCLRSACQAICRLLCSDRRVLPAAGIAEGEEGDDDWTGEEEDQDYLTEDSIDPDDMTYEVTTPAAPCLLALGGCAGCDQMAALQKFPCLIHMPDELLVCSCWRGTHRCAHGLLAC